MGHLWQMLKRIFAPRSIAVEGRGGVAYLHLAPWVQVSILLLLLGLLALTGGGFWFGAHAKQEIAKLETALAVSRRTHESFLTQLDDDLRNLANLRLVFDQQKQALRESQARERSFLEAVSLLAKQAPPRKDPMAWAVAQLEAQQRAEQEIEDQLNSVAKSFSALLGVAPPTDALAVAPWLAERLSAAEETFEGQRLALENSQVLVQASLARAEANLSVLPEALLGPGGLGLEGLGGKDGEPEGLAFLTLKDELASLRALSDRLERVQRLEVCVPFSAPVDYYNLSSPFGRRKDPFDGSPDWHQGIDLAAWPGTKVRATAAGKVAFAGQRSGYGNTVLIDHGCGLQTLYGHLESASVVKGQTINFRDEIGVVGSSGRSTGPHLHYEIRNGDEHLDPQKFIEAGRYVFKN